MKDILEIIKENEQMLIIGKATTFDIISYQKKLKQNNIAPMPEDFIKFIRNYNGLGYDDGTIYGINVEDDFLPNIIEKNLNRDDKHKEINIYLGENTFDYLVYNHQSSTYQIIDKSDLEVLKEYSNIKNGILYIIKV